MIPLGVLGAAGARRGGGDPHWQHVVLLMRMDGDSVDLTGRDYSEVGDVGYAPGKFGQALSLTQGDSGIRGALNVAALALPGDFTIECWIKMEPGAPDGALISLFDPAGSPGWQIYMQEGAPRWYQYFGGGAYLITPAGVDLRDGHWHHIAFSRSGATLRLFVDGLIPVAGSNEVGAAYGSTGLRLSIGYQDQGLARYPFRGQIDEVRITRAARYTVNFTAPTRPFPGP